MTRRSRLAILLAVALAGLSVELAMNRPLALPSNAGASLAMEELTWTEIRAALRAGTDTVIVPIGGTEQGGLHLALGKHNSIVARTTLEAAEQLGHTLVAPVMPYAPEGAMDEQEGNMGFTGTMGISEAGMEEVLTGIATSLKVHGFKTICFVGDHGGSQKAQAAVAKRLTDAWIKDGVIVLDGSDYYAHNGQMEFLRAQGMSDGTIGYHAGVRDTSELMFVAPERVRRDQILSPDQNFAEAIGSVGDPTKASPELGREMIALKVAKIVETINASRTARAAAAKAVN